MKRDGRSEERRARIRRGRARGDEKKIKIDGGRERDGAEKETAEEREGDGATKKNGSGESDK